MRIATSPKSKITRPCADSAVCVQFFRVAKRDKQRRPYRALVDAGVVAPVGCYCAHCVQGWDCCGKLFPTRVEVQSVRRGYRVTATYARNI